MISCVTTNVKQYSMPFTTNSVKESGTFENFLNNAANEIRQDNSVAEQAIAAMKKQLNIYDPHQTEKPTQIPEKWEKWVVEDTMILTAEKKAVEYLKQNGIDVSELKPTHEITPDQMEWLKSRHNFETIPVDHDSSSYQNLCADLIALNVFSFEEVRDMFLVSMPPEGVVFQKVDSSAANSSRVSFSDVGILGLGSGLGNLRQALWHSIGSQQEIISAFMKGKGNSPLSDSDKNFLNQAYDILSKKQEFYEILDDLFQ